MSWRFCGTRRASRPGVNTKGTRVLKKGHEDLLIRHRRRLLFLALLPSLTTVASYAKGPQGDFMCRRYEAGSPEGGGGSLTNVARMVLHSDGSYNAKDLTTSIPEVHGRFTYDAKTKTIQWDSGIWQTLLGHYAPNKGSGTPLFVVTTKKDPQGKVDGTFQCVRVSH